MCKLCSWLANAYRELCTISNNINYILFHQFIICTRRSLALFRHSCTFIYQNLNLFNMWSPFQHFILFLFVHFILFYFIHLFINFLSHFAISFLSLSAYKIGQVIVYAVSHCILYTNIKQYEPEK